MISPLAFLTFFNCLGGCYIAPKKTLKASIPEEIPEPGFSNDFIRSKDAHAIDFGVGLICGGQVTSDDLEFLKAHLVQNISVHIRTGRVSSIKRNIFSSLFSSVQLSVCMLTS
jgi:hypothetical protein